MKVIYKNLKEGKIKVLPETLEDLWHLSHIIQPGDFVEGKSFRAVDFGKSQERKPVFIKISVEKLEFAKFSNILRITGKIIEGKPEEYVQLGKYHTINLKPKEAIAIIKERWARYDLERLEEAVKESGRALLRIILIDEEKAIVADVRGYGFEILAEIKSGFSKRKGDEGRAEFYEKLLPFVEGICIIAGPGFEKDRFYEYVKEKGKKDVFKESVSYAEISGLREIVKKGIIEKILGEMRIAKEAKIMEEVMRRLAKDEGKIAYGEKEVLKAVELGAVEMLVVLDKLLREGKMREILKKVEKQGGKIFIFSSDSEWGRQLAGLGKVVALLRFPIAY